jgi:hypothetical protein
VAAHRTYLFIRHFLVSRGDSKDSVLSTQAGLAAR